MKKVLLLVLCMFCAVITAQEYDKDFLPGLTFTTFYPIPMETCGLYFPGEIPEQVIGIKNTGKDSAGINLKLKVTDYRGKTIEKKEISDTVAPGVQKVLRSRFTLPEKCGYYTIEAELFSAGKKYSQKQSSFIVLLPQNGRRDPFLGVNVVSSIKGKIPGLARAGFGTLEFGVSPYRYMDAYPWIYQMKQVKIKKKCPESFLDWFGYLRNVDEMRDAGFKVIGHIDVDIPNLPIRKQRIKDNLFAATDEDLKINAVFGELAAARYKGKIKMWVIGQEVDAHAMQTEVDCGFTLAQLTDYVLRVKQAVSGIRKGNPDAKITIMPSMCFDWSRNNPKFLFSKLIMKDLGNDFDYYGADVYVNAGDARRGRLLPPETGDAYRQYYIDAAALARSFDRPGLVFNNERGYGVLYFDKLDCEVNRQQGFYTARSIILARATNVCPYFSIHMSCIASYADRQQRNLLKHGKHTDYSIWKGIVTESREDGAFAKVPRPAVAFVSVVARELAFAKKGVQHKFNDEVYACSFDAPDEKQVIALWTTKIFSGADTLATISLDRDAVLNDGWGNLSTIKAGTKLKLRLTEIPLYLRFAGDADSSTKLLKKSSFIVDAPLRAYGRRINANTIRLQINSPLPAVQKGELLYAGKKTDVTVHKGINLIDIASAKDASSAVLTVSGNKNIIEVDPSAIKVKRIAGNTQFDHWFSKATAITLKPQEAVFPEIARMAEAGYFKMDGSDRPVKFYFAHDGKYLYIGATAPDVKHLQRFKNENLWRDDSLQIAFSPRMNFISSKTAKSSENNAFGSKEHNFGIALCGDTSVIFEYDVKNSPLNRSQVKVVHSGKETVYQAKIPLDKLGISSRKGSGFLASAVIFNNDNAANKYAPYHYSLGRGVTDGQNLSQFKTFIME